MTSVTELLAAALDNPACQRVREYHLTKRETTPPPKPKDFLTTLEHVGSELCVRQSDPAGESLIRHNELDWQCVEYDRVRGRKRVESVDAERVLEWLRGGTPELLAVAEIRGAFDPETSESESLSDSDSVLASEENELQVEDENDDSRGTRVVRQTDLLSDPSLESAFRTAGHDGQVFRLPLDLAEEVVLQSISGTDRLFVGKFVAERETPRAYYVRQGRAGCLVPKAATTRYELASPDDPDRTGQSSHA